MRVNEHNLKVQLNIQVLQVYYLVVRSYRPKYTHLTFYSQQIHNIKKMVKKDTHSRYVNVMWLWKSIWFCLPWFYTKDFKKNQFWTKYLQLDYHPLPSRDAFANIQVNVFLSDTINIQRGCRQGDPLSPYSFILSAEIVSIKIKNNKNIKGITIDNIEYKLSQFADDTSL